MTNTELKWLNSLAQRINYVAISISSRPITSELSPLADSLLAAINLVLKDESDKREFEIRLSQQVSHHRR